jgi:hypothetical protein
MEVDSCLSQSIRVHLATALRDSWTVPPEPKATLFQPSQLRQIVLT